MADPSSASTSGTVTCLRSTTTARPSITTSVMSGAAAAKTTFSTVAPPPAVRIESVCTATRSRARPTCERARVGPPEGVMTVVRRGAPAGGRRRWCRGFGRRDVRRVRRRGPLREDRSPAWLSEPRAEQPARSSSAGAGPMPSPRSRSVVGQKHTPVSMSGRGRRMSSAVRWVAHGGGPRAQHRRRRCSTPVGVRPCTPRHCSTSARSARRNARAAEHPCAAAHSTTAGMACDGNTPHRMQRGADQTPSVGCAQPAARRVHAVAHRSPVSSPNRSCGPANGAPSGPELRIAGVEQGESQARVGGTADHRVPHRVGFGVAGAACIVVHIVEFADRGDPCQRRSRRTPREVESPGSGRGRASLRSAAAVHQVAPGPERSPVALRAERSARWKRTCECALAGPGMTRPRQPVEAGCAAVPVSIAVMRPSRDGEQ